MKHIETSVRFVSFRMAVSAFAIMAVSACVVTSLPEADSSVGQSSGQVSGLADKEDNQETKVVVLVNPNLQNDPPAEMIPTVVAERALQAPSNMADLLRKVRQGRVTGSQKGILRERAFLLHRGHPTAQNEKYAHYDDNPVKLVLDNPVSTFSVDVDTGSYSLVRDRINQGKLPNPDAVRVEELINYFSYDYPQPEGDTPFSVTTDALVTPWNENTHLLRIGLQGKKFELEKRPAANLVFLLDVSGSMNAADKLPLLTKSLEFMTAQLTADDHVTIVVYAGASGLALDVTKGNETAKIRGALKKLRAGGSTAGGAGIELAYAKAKEAFIEGGINRIILATDGDFNVGISDVNSLKSVIAAKRESGISLTTLGFGDGNYNDELMEQLADIGNGNYAYIDNFREAKKVLGDQISSTLHTIAKDVKIQIEFNPAVVAEYRLIGYENRVLANEDFANDKVDAGEIGAGHSVTALYEITLVGGKGHRLPEKRYSEATAFKGKAGELAYVKLRYKKPGGDTSILLDHVIQKSVLTAPSALRPDLMHIAAVAAYGQLLSGSKYTENYSLADAAALASQAGRNTVLRSEFVALAEAATELKSMEVGGR